MHMESCQVDVERFSRGAPVSAKLMKSPHRDLPVTRTIAQGTSCLCVHRIIEERRWYLGRLNQGHRAVVGQYFSTSYKPLVSDKSI
jgi:hypothetical protein